MSHMTSVRSRRLFKLAFVMALTGTAMLQATNCAAGTTLRVGSRVLVIGDPVPRVLDLMGKPLYNQPILDSNGVYQGDKWFYRTESSSVTLVIIDGKLKDIDERIER